MLSLIYYNAILQQLLYATTKYKNYQKGVNTNKGYILITWNILK